MSRNLQKDQLPTDITVVTEHIDKLDLGPYGTNPLPKYMWRDFIEETLLTRGDEARVQRLLQQDSPEIIAAVLRRGSFNLGGGCHVIKCPSINQPGVCALCPIQTPEGERLVCSGPTVQREGRSLTLKKRTTYDKRWFRPRCPYAITRLDHYDRDSQEGFKHLLELVYPVVKKRPDYDTIDYRKEYGDLLEEMGID